MEDVTEEPSEVNELRGGKAKKSCDLVGDSHEKRVSGDPVEGEKVVVRELDDGSRTGSIVGDSRICVPSLASALEVVLETTPLVPFESAICEDEKDDDNDDDDRGDFRQLD